MNDLATLPDGEIIDAPPPEVHEMTTGYEGASTLALTQEQATLLMSPLADEDHDILPTGEVYISQVHYRRILNRVFGPGGWCLVPRGDWGKQGHTLTRCYALYVGGRFVSEAIGESDYQETNARMSWATTTEAVKSNAIMRVCKDIGIASECWDRRWTEKFKHEHCVKVWRHNKTSGKTTAEWRRKDADPFWNETGPVLERQPEQRQERNEIQPDKPKDEPRANASQCATIRELLRATGKVEAEAVKWAGGKEIVEELTSSQAEKIIGAVGQKAPALQSQRDVLDAKVKELKLAHEEVWEFAEKDGKIADLSAMTYSDCAWLIRALPVLANRKQYAPKPEPKQENEEPDTPW